MVSDPGETDIFSLNEYIDIVFYSGNSINLPDYGISRLNPFNFTLTAYYLTVYA
jgi:hypothetical protein